MSGGYNPNAAMWVKLPDPVSGFKNHQPADLFFFLKIDFHP